MVESFKWMIDITDASHILHNDNQVIGLFAGQFELQLCHFVFQKTFHSSHNPFIDYNQRPIC